MRPKFYILHDIPGRLRLHIPVLRENQDYEEIQSMFSSLRGIQDDTHSAHYSNHADSVHIG